MQVDESAGAGADRRTVPCLLPPNAFARRSHPFLHPQHVLFPPHLALFLLVLRWKLYILFFAEKH
jgi:hypothetical protein